MGVTRGSLKCALRFVQILARWFFAVDVTRVSPKVRPTICPDTWPAVFVVDATRGSLKFDIRYVQILHRWFFVVNVTTGQPKACSAICSDTCPMVLRGGFY